VTQARKTFQRPGDVIRLCRLKVVQNASSQASCLAKATQFDSSRIIGARPHSHNRRYTVYD
jgi:hypothetical protein